VALRVSVRLSANLQFAICNLQFAILFRRAVLVFALACLLIAPLRGDEIRIDLDKPSDPHVKPRIDAAGFALHVERAGYLQKLEPTTIRIETKQKGRWIEPRLETGRYLKADFDAENPRQVRIESTLKFDLAAGERRFTQERDWTHKEANRRTGGKDGGQLTKARKQVLIERINAIRDENIKAGADKRGKATPHCPPLPRPVAGEFEKPEALERILKEQCLWPGVAEVIKATGFPPPEEQDHADFAASLGMAEEVRQAMMGNRGTLRYLKEGQFNALADGSRYEFSARFVPELPGAPIDLLWENAPAVRLADGVIKRAQLEGSLDRERGQTVQWWRVECETFPKLDAKMVRGDGDCFWTWVETPDAHSRYVRVLLHSPGTRYRLMLSLIGASKGEDVTLYDGPVNAPTKGPF
jgi:hypothetical protein